MRHWDMVDALSVVGAVAAAIGLLWSASKIEPHWASKDGRRMIARVQPLGSQDVPAGRWREMRVLVDGRSVVLSSRGFGASALTGEFRARGKSPNPPRRRAIYVLEGERRVLLRVPTNSRAVPVLDALLDGSTTGQPER